MKKDFACEETIPLVELCCICPEIIPLFNQNKTKNYSDAGLLLIKWIWCLNLLMFEGLKGAIVDKYSMLPLCLLSTEVYLLMKHVTTWNYISFSLILCC